MSLNIEEEYCLSGYMEKKADKPKIIWCPYVPQPLSDEEYAKKFLANKTYAFVKYEYSDDKYANQKGEVLDEYDTDDGEKYYLLKINVAQKAKGFIHLVAFEPEYEEVWFSETDIQRFLKYDENGKPL